MKKLNGVYVADSLAHVKACASLGPNFVKAVEFLSRPNLRALANGRYELDGEKAYAIVSEQPLKAWGMGKPEVHHDYFDIQVILEGEETIGVGRFDPSAIGDFDAAKDIGFYPSNPVEPLTLRAGEFAVLYPKTCAHAPCCTLDGAARVRKIVVKVRA